MKKQPKVKVVKALASQFEEELNKSLPITIRQDGSIVFKDYFIKVKKNGNWGLYNIRTRDQIDEFFLKTCALMAAKAYARTGLEKFIEIKRLDSAYWSNYSDTVVFRNNIKKAANFDKYLILLNRLEESETQTQRYKEEISRMFHFTFA
jgi:hypothetical protein